MSREDAKTILEAVDDIKGILNGKCIDTIGNTVLSNYFLGKANERLDIINEKVKGWFYQ